MRRTGIASTRLPTTTVTGISKRPLWLRRAGRNGRGRAGGGRRSDLQDEIRFQLEQGYDDLMDLDEDADPASPSPAAEYASRMLYAKETQRGSRWENERVPMVKGEGKKRTCCMSVSPSGGMA